MKSLVPVEHIEQRIYLMHGLKVMLDADLARIYGVTTKRLNQQVRRNLKRFPQDFMFQLTKEEADSLRLQNATLNSIGRGRHRKYRPYVFTEYGAVMLSSVLSTRIAVEASVQIARAFVKLRELLNTHRELAAKLEAIERRLSSHDAELGEQADQLRAVFKAIHRLMEPPKKPRRRIGFQP